MRSKNVTTLPSGTRVIAEATGGKWIQVRTTDGLTGYVRERQLEFSDGENQL
ncbi:SH3 domain-containing protein [Luteimonas composti]